MCLSRFPPCPGLLGPCIAPETPRCTCTQTPINWRCRIQISCKIFAAVINYLQIFNDNTETIRCSKNNVIVFCTNRHLPNKVFIIFHMGHSYSNLTSWRKLIAYIIVVVDVVALHALIILFLIITYLFPIILFVSFKRLDDKVPHKLFFISIYLLQNKENICTVVHVDC